VASARRRASSSSRSASAVSPANQSSLRCGSQPIPSAVTAGSVDSSSRSRRHHGQLEVARLARHDDDERAETGSAGALDERERRGGVVGEERRAPVPERGCDGALATRRDLEQVEDEPLPLLGERARGGGQAFALGDRPLEGRQPLAGEPDELVVVAAASAAWARLPRPRARR
jgi:hypothetical protein